MIDKIINYINQSPRMKYFEIQIIFFVLLMYLLVTLFSTLLVCFDYFLKVPNLTVFQNLFRIFDIFYLLTFLFLQMRTVFFIQGALPIKKTKTINALVYIFIITLFFIFIDFTWVFFEKKLLNDVLITLWNTCRVMFFYLLAYAYIKYSKRSHAYFNFYDQKTG